MFLFVSSDWHKMVWLLDEQLPFSSTFRATDKQTSRQLNLHSTFHFKGGIQGIVINWESFFILIVIFP